MNDKFNTKIEQIAISDIRQFDTEVSAIPGIIKLTLGEPDFNTPDHIKQAAIKAIEANKSHYTPNAGLPALRKAAADYYNKKFNLHYQPEQVVTTIGATEGIAASLQTIINPDDTVIVPTPIFPIYIPDTKINEGNVILVDTSKDNFVLTADRLRQVIEEHPLARIKALVLNYPCNPTGVTYSRQQLEAIAQVARDYDFWIISDEIYAELTYQKKHISMGEVLPEKTILLTGLSKSHAMTGWRIGYILGPQDFIEQVVKSHQYMVTSPTTVSQYAALEAMTNGQRDSLAMKKEYDKRRAFLVKELAEAGFKTASADGAFYLFAKIPAGCVQDSWTFVRSLAQQAKVALIPGVSFGPGGEGYVRISYAASMKQLQQAAAAIKQYVAQHSALSKGQK
ncbi:MAG: pyridoxal phosphate-dependent aminotransferase [Liquorilactobacillus ghanensis]|uniref:pyridoxal phosphate-dependent aminotransferase n=1 Tax=Liquorilactobacillus ghanensis TaxID=399370 RepID=UPI000708EBAF|nr:pyridoxal phosphate-dependent aminotransferase [Liquorilactobacillus ghanensis]